MNDTIKPQLYLLLNYMNMIQMVSENSETILSENNLWPLISPFKDEESALVDRKAHLSSAFNSLQFCDYLNCY